MAETMNLFSNTDENMRDFVICSIYSPNIEVTLYI